VQGGELQLGLFDERNLFEFSRPDFPGERLMACRNVDLGKLRAHKREALLVATEQELQKIHIRIENGALAARDKIGIKVGKVVNKYKVGKRFALTIEEVRSYKALAASSGTQETDGGAAMCVAALPDQQRFLGPDSVEYCISLLARAASGASGGPGLSTVHHRVRRAMR
jgi:hypothetical protein